MMKNLVRGTLFLVLLCICSIHSSAADNQLTHECEPNEIRIFSRTSSPGEQPKSSLCLALTTTEPDSHGWPAGTVCVDPEEIANRFLLDDDPTTAPTKINPRNFDPALLGITPGDERAVIDFLIDFYRRGDFCCLIPLESEMPERYAALSISLVRNEDGKLVYRRNTFPAADGQTADHFIIRRPLPPGIQATSER